MELTARLKASGTNPSGAAFTAMTTGHIEQGWHQEDGHVSYEIALASLEGQRPAFVPANSPYRAEAEKATSQAKEKWNNEMAKWNSTIGTIFSPIPSNPLHAPHGVVPDVTIKGYWDSGADTGHCGKGAACTTPGGTYPHIGQQTLWIKYPPKGQHTSSRGQTQTTEWTTVRTLATNQSDVYYYLPMVMMHEFGHAAGVGHLYEPGVVMGDYAIVADLSDDDKDGMNAVLVSHVHP